MKVTKTSVDLITLTKGDLFDIGKTIRDVTKDALQEMRMEQNTVLGVLQTQLQGL